MSTPLDRFFEAAGCRTQTELAEFLGIRQSSIADAKKRGNIPSDWLLTLWRKKAVNPDWVLTGKGSVGLQPSGHIEGGLSVLMVKEKLSPENYTTEELLTEIIFRVLKDVCGSEQGRLIVKDLFFGDQSESSR